MICTSKRPDMRRQDRKERAKAFNHESASAAKLRHRVDRANKPRKPKKAKAKTPVSPLDHIHPRHKREWMRAHPEAEAA
jgi:hypothetical protein